MSTPALSWNAALKWQKWFCQSENDKWLELIPDPDLHIFSEKVMRGGVSYISNRYSQANNKYLKSYDPKKESKHIIYFDVSNLHGYATSKFLPTSGFACMNPKVFHLNKYTSNSS